MLLKKRCASQRERKVEGNQRTMYASKTILRCLFFVLFGVLTSVVTGQGLSESRGSLAGAIKQYEERRKVLQDCYKNDADFMSLLIKEKKRWDDFLSHFPVEPSNANSFEEQATLIRDRSKWLNGILVNPATKSDSEGLYWDGFGNSLRIKKVKGECYFSLRKYSYLTRHMGVVSGVLSEWKDSRATFKGDFGAEIDPSAEYFPRKPKAKIGSVKFEFCNGLLIVTTSGSIKSIGGPRASFASVYSRVAALKKGDDRILRDGLKNHGPLKFQSPFK